MEPKHSAGAIAEPLDEQEGVIKYQLDFRLEPPLPVSGFSELNAWRSVLWRLGVIGQDDARYDGLGYGNLSLRLGAESFLVSGTQTGHLPQLTVEQYAVVRKALPEKNYLSAAGPLPPSSEALTHAAIYAVDSEVCCVMHGHSPEIWQRAGELDLPCVDARIAYGTPAMAEAVGMLVRAHPEQGIVAMLGHRDGLLTYGRTPDEAGWLMTQCLARALTV